MQKGNVSNYVYSLMEFAPFVRQRGKSRQTLNFGSCIVSIKLSFYYTTAKVWNALLGVFHLSSIANETVQSKQEI